MSLLPICGDIFESILFNNIFIFFPRNKLITQKELEFKPTDSCMNQLLSIIHEIYKSLDNEYIYSLRTILASGNYFQTNAKR